MKRIALFIYRVFKLRSVSRALWVQNYEDHVPKHGGK